MRLAIEEAQRDGREAIDDSLLDGVDSPGADTMSDDGTIDGNDHLMDPVLNPHRHGISFATTPGNRPRPRSLHDLPSYHVEMPFLPFDQLGPWTPGAPLVPEDPASLAPPHLNLMSSNSLYDLGGFDRRSRSPGIAPLFHVPTQHGERARSTSRTPSRRHSMASGSTLFGPPPVPPHMYGESGGRPVDFGHYTHEPRTSYFSVDESRRYPAWPAPLFSSDHSRRPMPGAAFRNPNDVRVSYLRPEPGFSAFDANHEAIMSTIPGSRAGSRHPSRSNSPQISRVNSRSRLGNLLVPSRSYASTPLSQGDTGGRSSRTGRSRERSRLREEAHREAMLQALAEADAAQQLRPGFLRADSDTHVSLPLLAPELMERVEMSPVTPVEPRLEARLVAAQRQPAQDADQDVTMTQ